MRSTVRLAVLTEPDPHRADGTRLLGVLSYRDDGDRHHRRLARPKPTPTDGESGPVQLRLPFEVALGRPPRARLRSRWERGLAVDTGPVGPRTSRTGRSGVAVANDRLVCPARVRSGHVRPARQLPARRLAPAACRTADHPRLDLELEHDAYGSGRNMLNSNATRPTSYASSCCWQRPSNNSTRLPHGRSSVRRCGRVATPSPAPPAAGGDSSKKHDRPQGGRGRSLHPSRGADGAEAVPRQCLGPSQLALAARCVTSCVAGGPGPRHRRTRSGSRCHIPGGGGGSPCMWVCSAELRCTTRERSTAA
jgi:hypothetical protein